MRLSYSEKANRLCLHLENVLYFCAIFSEALFYRIMKSTQNREGKRLGGWLPVVGLTFSTFVFNTSEFIPIGLLSDIARDFSMTEAQAGSIITIYAWVVALASLPLMLMASKVENRKLLLGVIALFIAGHVLSAVASTYAILVASRIVVACAHAIFWSIVSPLAVRIAPEGKRSTALGLIVTGSSVAMIVGLPLGRIVGLHVGWRMTFFCIAVAALAVFLLLAFIFPKVPSRNSVSLKKLPSLLKTPALLGVYVLTLVLVTAHFTGYSYIEPFLGQVAGLGDAGITWVLMAFGVVGLVGSVLFSRYYDRYPFRFVRSAVFGVSVCLLLLQVSAYAQWSVILLCVGWGLAIALYNLVFQSEVIQIMPESTAIAMSVYLGIYNVGIGGGALVGGLVCTHLSLSHIGYVGGAIAVVASLYCAKRLMPLLKRQG